jgi:hypothetical protein
MRIGVFIRPRHCPDPNRSDHCLRQISRTCQRGPPPRRSPLARTRAAQLAGTAKPAPRNRRCAQTRSRDCGVAACGPFLSRKPGFSPFSPLLRVAGLAFSQPREKAPLPRRSSCAPKAHRPSRPQPSVAAPLSRRARTEDAGKRALVAWLDVAQAKRPRAHGRSPAQRPGRRRRARSAPPAFTHDLSPNATSGPERSGPTTPRSRMRDGA